MHTFQPTQLVRDFLSDPAGNVLIIDPEEDSTAGVPMDDTFAPEDRVGLHIPADDGSMWNTLGTILDVDLDEEQTNPLLLVRIDWETAAPLVHESS